MFRKSVCSDVKLMCKKVKKKKVLWFFYLKNSSWTINQIAYVPVLFQNRVRKCVHVGYETQQLYRVGPEVCQKLDRA